MWGLHRKGLTWLYLQASQALLEQLPRYSDLVAVVSGGSGGQDGRVRFHADYVLAAEMQFRMQLLGPLIPLLDEKVSFSHTMGVLLAFSDKDASI